MIPLRSLVLLGGVPGEVRGRQQGLECGKPFKRYDVLTSDGMVKNVPEERLVTPTSAAAQPARVGVAAAGGQ